MKIRVDKFCSLATARDWQAWLYEYDLTLYKEFITKLRHTKGCYDNRQLMIDTLGLIDKKGGSPKLLVFLRLHHPHLILDDAISLNGSEFDRIFSQNILTFPHRRMWVGPRKQLLSILDQFMSDKINCEFIIVNDRAYIEYLNNGEEHLITSIPQKNWMIRSKKDEQHGKT